MVSMFNICLQKININITIKHKPTSSPGVHLKKQKVSSIEQKHSCIGYTHSNVVSTLQG